MDIPPEMLIPAPPAPGDALLSSQAPPDLGRTPPWRVILVLAFSLGLGFLGSAVAVMIVAGVREGAAAMGSHEVLARAARTFSGFLSAILSIVAANALVVWSATRASGLPARVRLRLGPSGLSGGTLAVMVLGMMFLSHALDTLVRIAGLQGEGSLGFFQEVFGRATAPQIVVAAIVVGPLVGLVEELLFRGYVQTALAARWGPARAVLVTALLFGLGHLDAAQGSMAVFLGLYLGLITEWTGSIRPAILCHAVNNLLGVVGTALLPLAKGPPPASGSLAVSAVGLALTLGWLARSMRARTPSAAAFTP